MFSVAVVDSRSNAGTGSVTVLVGIDAPPGTSTSPLGGDPGVVLDTGGVVAVAARCGAHPAHDTGLSLAMIALLWGTLVIHRTCLKRRD